MTLRENFVCVVLAHGSLLGGGHTLAQGFNKRYDALNQALAQSGYSIERSAGHFQLIGATGCVTSDGLYYNPLVCSLLLNDQGVVLGSDTIVYTEHALYPGTWNCMAPRTNGGFVAGGATLSQTEANRHALWLLDPEGSITLVAEYGSEGAFNSSRQAIECKNGDFLLVGETDSLGTPDASLIRTDSTGAVLWNRTYGGELSDRGWSVDTAADDGFFMGGQYGYINGGAYGRQWVLRVDAVGDTVWQRIWGGEMTHQSALLTTKASGNPIICGTTAIVENTDRQCYMAELDESNGDLLWERRYDYLNVDAYLLIAKEVAPGAGHIAIGVLYDTQEGDYNGIMLRTADNGDSLWMRTFVYQDTIMSNGQGALNDVVPTLDGGFIACGTAYNELSMPYPPGYSQDVWVVKVDSLGCIEPGCNIPMGITTQITNMGYALSVYPNPVRDRLHVSIKLPVNFKTEGPLSLTVVSSDGKLVRQQGVETSAPNEVSIDVTGLAVGAYTVHLSDAHTWIAGKKFVVE